MIFTHPFPLLIHYSLHSTLFIFIFHSLILEPFLPQCLSLSLFFLFSFSFHFRSLTSFHPLFHPFQSSLEPRCSISHRIPFCTLTHFSHLFLVSFRFVFLTNFSLLALSLSLSCSLSLSLLFHSISFPDVFFFRSFVPCSVHRDSNRYGSSAKFICIHEVTE